MQTPSHEDPRIVAATERQMQNWVRLEEAQSRAIGKTPSAGSMVSYISLSRETGAGCSEIAPALGKRLGWEVLDKNLLDRVAERFHETRTMLELVDETPQNWAFDVLGSWMDRHIVSHQRYVAQLSRVLLAATRHGNCIIVGRGAQFLLPRDKVLAVRIVAPEKYRIERVAHRQKISLAEAQKIVRGTDIGRRVFVKRFFRRDISDSYLYDLVINVQRVGLPMAVELILAAMHRG